MKRRAERCRLCRYDLQFLSFTEDEDILSGCEETNMRYTTTQDVRTNRALKDEAIPFLIPQRPRRHGWLRIKTAVIVTAGLVALLSLADAEAASAAVKASIPPVLSWQPCAPMHSLISDKVVMTSTCA